MRRITAALVLVLAAAAGCAGTTGAPPGATPSDSGAFADRARAVADAWRAGPATGAWRTGFVPLADLTVPPAGGFPNDNSKQAYINGWYAATGPLPTAPFGPGTIGFPDGSTMSVPLVSGQDAYAALDKGDAPGCPKNPVVHPGPGTGGSPACATLLVTDVTLGETKLRTSRGEATVPAWLFSVMGLREPIARVAVAPSAVTPLPSPSVPPAPRIEGFVTAQDLVGVDGAKVTYRLGVGACDYDIRPLLYETGEVVVVGGSVKTKEGACIAILKLEPVTVTLATPLGGRPVVDAATGAPLVLTVR